MQSLYLRYLREIAKGRWLSFLPVFISLAEADSHMICNLLNAFCGIVWLCETSLSELVISQAHANWLLSCK